MLKRRRKRKALPGLGIRAKLITALLLLAAAACALYSALDSCVGEPIMALARERARELAAGTMSFAAIAAAEQEQGEMLTVTKAEGESYLVIADTAKVNRAAGLASADALERMNEIGRQGISINLGDLSGLSMLCGSGPEITAAFTPVGSVTAETVSSLRSSGINQCIYSVDLKLTARIKLVVAGRAEIITVAGVNPICQTVIVGNVPQVYTNVANEEDMLNLIPTELP